MARLLVVGLLPQQASRLASEYPDLDVRFVGKNNADLSRDAIKYADRVYVMSKFTAHGTQYKVPRAKLRLVPGGYDAIRERLNGEATLRTLYPPPKLVVPEAPKEEDTMAKDLRFGEIKDLQPGKSMALERPKHLKRDMFKARVANSVSRYRSLGYELEVTYDYAEDTALITRKAPPPREVVAMVEKHEAREEPVITGSVSPELAEPEPTINTKDIYTRPNGMPPELGMGYAGLLRPAKIPEHVVWKDILTESMRLTPMLSIEHHISVANAAAEAYRRRYN